jgi:pantetheine-phosphate adenylyltransferase
MQLRRAIYPGSFDPFTFGHSSIVSRSLGLVDELIIGIGVNHSKGDYFPLANRLKAIAGLYREEPRVQVMSYAGLTIDFAREVGADMILRGIRSMEDFEYERRLAELNCVLSGGVGSVIETVFLFADPVYSSISSSIVRELLTYGKDVSCFIPFQPEL